MNREEPFKDKISHSNFPRRLGFIVQEELHSHSYHKNIYEKDIVHNED